MLPQTLDTVVVVEAACNCDVHMTTELEDESQTETSSSEDSVTQKGVEQC